MNALAEQHCTACTKDMTALDAATVAAHLQQIPGWTANADSREILHKRSFKNYMTALDFINKISILAEAENHHPDIAFGWGYATITLSTHSIDGLSPNDFILAAKINALDTQ